MSDVTARLSAALADRYRIERHLGEGGMATVYLAEDLKHARKVAVKVLRPELAAILGAERFLNEITVTANLQHPNILPVYDSGEADTFLYYVMPYMEGETLRERIDREKQLGVEETVEVAKSVAGALQFAHERGVIHRDIKPENILLQSGQPLVADFGIALAVTTIGGNRLTETGLSLGTPHYMSPEQATGDRALDARSDVYALGATVYEMLVGEPPHVGNSVQAIVAKILSDTPTPITRARELVPHNVDAAVQKALAKSPADRFASAEKFAEALTNPAFTLATVPAAAVATAGEGPWKRIGLGLAVLAAVTTIVAVWSLLRPTPAPPVVRYRLQGAPGEERLGGVALSPDGRELVYVGPGPRGGQLWHRSRDALNAVPIPGTQSGFRPFFSADGERVGFFTVDPSSIQMVPLQGGQPTMLVTRGQLNVGGGAYEDADGYVYFTGNRGAKREDRGVQRVAATGGVPGRVTAPDSGRNEVLHLWPSGTQSGRGVVFTVAYGGQDPGEFDVAVADLSSGEHRVLMRGVYARYAASGHLLVVTSAGTLLAAPFDDGSLSLVGEAIPVLENIRVRAAVGPVSAQIFGAVVRVSIDGTLIYLQEAAASEAGEVEERSLVWVSRDGGERPAFDDWSRGFGTLAISPDGGRVVTAIAEGGNVNLWSRAFGGGTPVKLTFTRRTNYRPVWHPDGRTVTWVGYTFSPGADLLSTHADGTGREQLVLDLPRAVFEGLWSPDGEWLIYRTDNNEADRGDILAYHVARDTSVSLVATRFEEHSPAVSPDGRWLAFVSDREGRPGVYVRPFPDTRSGVWRVSNGSQPLWSRSGRELFYLNERGQIVAVAVNTESAFSIGEETPLFSTSGYLRPTGSSIGTFNHPVYAVAPDDQRFLMIKMPLNTEGELIVVENFLEELKAKVVR